MNNHIVYSTGRTMISVISFLFSMLIILCACNSLPENVTFSAGPSINIGEVVEIGISLNNRGEYTFTGGVSVPLVYSGPIGKVNLNAAVDVVLNQVRNKTNHLVILWKDDSTAKSRF